MTAPALRSSRLVFAYRRYLVTTDAPRFASEVGRYFSTSTLHRLLQAGGTELRRGAAIALGMLGDGPSIEHLGRHLCDVDRGVRLAADDSFRGLLVRNAAPVHQQKLLKIMHLNDGGEFAAALAPALILVDQTSNYAEAHHQLAICWMGLGDLIAAEHAYRDCLWQCRFHYPSWIGLAHCRLRSEEPSNHDLRVGLRALRRAVAICPDLEHARSEARRLEKALETGNLEDQGGARYPFREDPPHDRSEAWGGPHGHDNDSENSDAFWERFDGRFSEGEDEDEFEG